MKTLTVRFHHRLYGNMENQYFDPRYVKRGTSQSNPAPDHKTYDYLFDGDAKEGDIALVLAPSTGYTAVTVVSVAEGRGSKATKYALAVFDVAAHALAEAQRAEREKKRKEITDKLDAAVAEVHKVMHYQAYRSASPTVAKLLDELAELDNQTRRT